MGHFLLKVSERWLLYCWPVGRIKLTCQTLLRDGGQEVYSFLCSLWEESDKTEIVLTKYLKLKSINLDSLRLV